MIGAGGGGIEPYEYELGVIAGVAERNRMGCCGAGEKEGWTPTTCPDQAGGGIESQSGGTVVER